MIRSLSLCISKAFQVAALLGCAWMICAWNVIFDWMVSQ